MSRWKNLPPLTAGREYMGWMGFSEGAPFTFGDNDYGREDHRAEIFPTKSAARARFEDVRRVRIIVEKEKA